MATLAQAPVSRPLTFTLDLPAIEAGVPLETMTDFLQSAGLELKDIYDVVIPARTLTHRRARNEHLSLAESERLARLMRIYDHTLRIYGTAEKAAKFLRRPKEHFQGRSPLQMMHTEPGGKLVDDMLWGIADGVFI